MPGTLAGKSRDKGHIMGRSSLLGSEQAAMEPAGRDIAALGPGDNSDSGSDTVGLEDRDTDDPVERHPARRGGDARSGGDIGVDRIFTPGRTADDGDVDDSALLSDDEDPDLEFVGNAVAGDPTEDEEAEDVGDEVRSPNDHADRMAGAQATPHRSPVPGQSPAPDRPENPGLPGEGDDQERPADDGPDSEQRRPGPGRAAGRRGAPPVATV